MEQPLQLPDIEQSEEVMILSEDDDEDDGNTDFSVEGQFQGESGQKLLELKSKWNFNERFQIDERFKETPAYVDFERFKEAQGYVDFEGGEDLLLDKEKNEEMTVLDQMFGREAIPTVQTTKDICEDDNEPDDEYDSNESDSDVVDLFEDDVDMFQKLEGQPMICHRCYPTTHFRKRSLYIIHRIRHYAESHFICPICKKGFVKLIDSINHELIAHKDETKLRDQGFSSALTIILSDEPGKQAEDNTNNTQANTIETQKTENNYLPADYAIVSSSLYPYKGPPLPKLMDSYEMQFKYGRPQNSRVNNIAKNAVQWKNQIARFDRRELVFEAQQERRKVQNESQTASGTASTVTKSDNGGSDTSSCGKDLKTKKRKRYRKKRRKSDSPEASYCCKICDFKCSSNNQFKYHKSTAHPNLTEAETLQYFILPTVGSYSPVRKKKTGSMTVSNKVLETEGSDCSSNSSSLASSSFSSTPSVSVMLHDLNSQEGLSNALGLVKNINLN